MHETFKLLVKTVKLSGGTLTDQGSRREIFESFCDEESTLQYEAANILTSFRDDLFRLAGLAKAFITEGKLPRLRIGERPITKLTLDWFA